MKKKLKPIKTLDCCIVCGRSYPNSYGDCGCSYDIKYFQDRSVYELIHKLGLKVYPELKNIKL